MATLTERLKGNLTDYGHGDGRATRAWFESFYISTKAKLPTIAKADVKELAEIYASHRSHLAPAMAKLVERAPEVPAAFTVEDIVARFSSLDEVSKPGCECLNRLASGSRVDWTKQTLSRNNDIAAEAALGTVPFFEFCKEQKLPIKIVYKDSIGSKDFPMQAQGVIKTISNYGRNPETQELNGFPIVFIEGEFGGVYIRDMLAVTSPSHGKLKWDFGKNKEIVNDFLTQHVRGNPNLSAEAREYLECIAPFEQGPWTVRGHVLGVREDSEKVTVVMRTGEAYYYPPNRVEQGFAE